MIIWHAMVVPGAAAVYQDANTHARFAATTPALIITPLIHGGMLERPSSVGGGSRGTSEATAGRPSRLGAVGRMEPPWAVTEPAAAERTGAAEEEEWPQPWLEPRDAVDGGPGSDCRIERRSRRGTSSSSSDSDAWSRAVGLRLR